jgi:hypothetical protein
MFGFVFINKDIKMSNIMHTLFSTDWRTTKWTMAFLVKDLIDTFFAATPMTARNEEEIPLTIETNGALRYFSGRCLKILSS